MLISDPHPARCHKDGRGVPTGKLRQRSSDWRSDAESDQEQRRVEVDLPAAPGSSDPKESSRFNGGETHDRLANPEVATGFDGRKSVHGRGCAGEQDEEAQDRARRDAVARGPALHVKSGRRHAFISSEELFAGVRRGVGVLGD